MKKVSNGLKIKYQKAFFNLLNDEGMNEGGNFNHKKTS